MDEYIKLEDALDAVLFGLVGTGYQSRAIEAIRGVSTADVVPREELEGYKHNWQKLHDSYTADCAEYYSKGWRDGVMTMLQKIAISCADIPATTESLDFEIGYYTAMNVVLNALNELKKKYTGDRKE